VYFEGEWIPSFFDAIACSTVDGVYKLSDFIYLGDHESENIVVDPVKLSVERMEVIDNFAKCVAVWR
jgi:hypothetical protein